MANISTYTALIKSAPRGETVRDSIDLSIEQIDQMGKDNVRNLNHIPAKEFLQITTYFSSECYDTKPRQGSKKYVTSGGLLTTIEKIAQALDYINGEEVTY